MRPPAKYQIERIPRGSYKGLRLRVRDAICTARTCYRKHGLIYLDYGALATMSPAVVWEALELAADRGWLPPKLRILDQGAARADNRS